MSVYINIALQAVLVTVLLVALPVMVRCSEDDPIPADKSKIKSWFERNVGVTGRTPANKATLVPELAKAEAAPKVIKVKAKGGGKFKTITDAIKSVPENNKNRVIISIGPGNYKEKIKIDMNKPFITLYGENPKDMPVLVHGDTAKKQGTLNSATFAVESNYFIGVNLKIVNSAPRPDGKTEGAQAVAMKISGDHAAFYNCRFHGFQDTLCDDKGKHFFKDCYIEGTVDFIFGSGQSIYLNSEIHVVPGDAIAIIVAHARTKTDERNGYIFVHCKVTGSGRTTVLARSWFSHGRVIFAYSELSDVVKPEGWSTNHHQHNSTVFFGEYNNKGPGANLEKRASFVKKLTAANAKPFLNLGYIKGSKWLLPPPKV